MKKFLAIYLGSSEALARWKGQDDELRKKNEAAGMGAWMQWASDHADAIVYDGSPLGKTLRVDVGGVSGTKNEIGAYTVVQADSHEEAAKMFENHPHFTIFPGESIEVIECLPMPKV